MARAEVAEALESLDKRCRIMGLSSQYRQAAPRSLPKTPRVQVSPLESLVQTPRHERKQVDPQCWDQRDAQVPRVLEKRADRDG